jgi:hypothetical protein
VTRLVTCSFFLFVVCSAVSCGSSSGASPATPTPAVPQISGEWLGEETVATLDGGECLAAPLQKDLVGFPGQFTGTFTQSGSAVTASLDIDHTGAVCNYSGTISGTSLTLEMTGCTPTHTQPVSCPGGGTRDLVLLAEHVTASIAADRMTGTFEETDNILVSGSTTSVGTLAARGPFLLMRRVP